MNNHYHLVVETPKANLVAGMAWLRGICTIRLNHRQKRQAGQHHFGELRPETAQAKAERIISEELVRLGSQPAELTSRRKHDPAKLEVNQTMAEPLSLLCSKQA